MTVRGNFSQIGLSYEDMFLLLGNYFSLNAYDLYEEAENAMDLLEIAMDELFGEQYERNYIETVLFQMQNFLEMPIPESSKALLIRHHIEVELPGLTPIQFLQFLSYRIQIELWKMR